MDATIRLRIATRIHFALLRHYGERVDVAGLLRGDAEAREALWVCEGSGHAELVNLAQQFIDATEADADADADTHKARRSARPWVAAPTGAARPAPRDAVWARDTTGFVVSHPAQAAGTAHGAFAPAGWQMAARWLRRAAGR